MQNFVEGIFLILKSPPEFQGKLLRCCKKKSNVRNGSLATKVPLVTN